MGLLLAPVEGFGLRQKNSLLFFLAHLWRFFVSSSKFNKFQKIQKYKTNTKNLKNIYKKIPINPKSPKALQSNPLQNPGGYPEPDGGRRTEQEILVSNIGCCKIFFVYKITKVYVFVTNIAMCKLEKEIISIDLLFVFAVVNY